MPSRGWPFLVGRGRRAGHRVLLAPDFLVSQQDHGILATASPEATEVVTATGDRLAMRCSTHQVDAEDVGSGERPRDEHGRPLRLIYGVVATGVTPVNADLPLALSAALGTYRRFLHRESDFAVEPSTAFELAAPTPEIVPAVTVEPRRVGHRVAVLCASSTLAIVLTVLLGRSNSEPVPGTPVPKFVPSVTSTTPTTTPAVTTKIG